MRCSFFEDESGERFRRILIEHRHRRLLYDGAGIEPFIHKVHSAAGNFDSVGDRLVLRVKARKRRQKRRMNVQDSPAEYANEKPYQKAHITGEEDELDIGVAELGDNLTVEYLAILAFRCHRSDAQAALASQLQAGSVGVIRKHQRDFGVQFSTARSNRQWPENSSLGRRSERPDASFIRAYL